MLENAVRRRGYWQIVFLFTSMRARKLRAAIELKTLFGNFLLHQNSILFTVTFGEKMLTLAKSPDF